MDYPSVLFTFLCTTRASILSLFEQGFDLDRAAYRLFSGKG